ncbi:MAG: UPF0149 family protein [Pararhodobacter sp.]|nr:UPF0149 family protein [Pararhodobacter sp.]
MADGQLEALLAELARLRDDDGARREVLDRASFSMLHRPALGGQVVARICAAEENAPELEPLAELLGSALDAARMASENRKKRGDAFLRAVTDAVELAAGQDRLPPFHRMLIASAWARNGLPAPAALEIPAADIEASGLAPGMRNRAEAEAMLDDLFRNLIEQSAGDALALHAALAETFPAMPADMRAYVISLSAERPEPILAKLCCFWLLDRDAAIRAAAARALADRAVDGALSAELAGKMVVLRNWMPRDEARAKVDQAVKLAMRSGLTAGAAPKPWTLRSILATLPDGGGAQSIMMALQSGGSRKVAMLLLKQDHGVKDAYTIPCNSASEQKALVQRIRQETGAASVPATWIEGALSSALADGLAAGLPPAPGLIEVAELCGLDLLRPEAVPTETLIANLPATERILSLSAQARGRLINASEGWWDRHEIVQSWFEESDPAHEVLEGTRSSRGVEAALWRWLDTRRDYWARVVARAADVLSAAGDPDADSFTATAMALLDGRDLKKIPVMLDVHEQTIEAWVFDDPDTDQGATLDEWVGEAEPKSPKPERKGELARLLKGAAITADWIDGFLMAVTLAPKMIAPNRWLPEILGSAVASLTPDSIQRFADLILMRANACVDHASAPAEFATAMSGRSKMAMRDWAAGFSYACGHFRASWPAKSTAPDDRAMMNRVSDAMSTGFSAAEVKTLSQWIAARHARNMGA